MFLNYVIFSVFLCHISNYAMEGVIVLDDDETRNVLIEIDEEDYELFPVVSAKKKIGTLEQFKKILKKSCYNNVNQVGNISEVLFNTEKKIKKIMRITQKIGYSGLLMYDTQNAITFLAKIFLEYSQCPLSIKQFSFFLKQTPEYLFIKEKKTGKTLLHRLCESNRFYGCEIAIKQGALLHECDYNGKKPLDYLTHKRTIIQLNTCINSMHEGYQKEEESRSEHDSILHTPKKAFLELK